MKKLLLFASVATVAFGAQAQNPSNDWEMAVQYVQSHINDATPSLKAAALAAIEANTATQDIQALYNAAAPAIESNARALGNPNAIDVTNLIVNPLAANGNNGWNQAQRDGGSNIGKASRPEEVPTMPAQGVIGTYFDGGNWLGSNWTVSFEQTVTLPAGSYRLSVMGRGEKDLSWNRMVVTPDVEGVRVNGHVVNEATTTLPHVDLAMYGAGGTVAPYTRGWYDSYIDFESDGTTPMVIAMQSSATPTHQWVSFTNFRLTKFTETAALVQEANELLNSSEYAVVTGTERGDLSTVATANGATVAELNAAINAFKAARAAYQNRVDVFAVWTANRSKALEATPALLTAFDEALAATPTNAADANAQADAANVAGRAALLSSSVGAGKADYNDLSDLIKNRLTTDDIREWAWEAEPGYALGNMRTMSNEAPFNTPIVWYFDTNSWNNSNWGGRFSQTTQLLDAGNYRVTVLARGNTGFDYYQLFAKSGDNEVVADVEKIGNTGGLFGRGWNVYQVDITTTERAPLTLGVKAATTPNQQWLSFGDFHLSFFGNMATSSVADIETESNTPAQYFDLQGRPVANPQAGVYVVRQGTKVSKVVVR